MFMLEKIKSWRNRPFGAQMLPLAMVLAFSFVGLLPSLAQAPIAAQPAGTQAAVTQSGATQSVAPATSTPTTASASAPVLPAAPLPSSGGLPLSNIDLLNKMDDDRLPTSPRRFLKARFKQVRKAKDEKILQLLLVCVGFVGVFVAILALRSVPPARSSS